MKREGYNLITTRLGPIEIQNMGDLSYSQIFKAAIFLLFYLPLGPMVESQNIGTRK